MARQRLGSIGVAVIVGNHVTDPWLKPAGVLAHPVDGIGAIVACFPQRGGTNGKRPADTGQPVSAAVLVPPSIIRAGSD